VPSLTLGNDDAWVFVAIAGAAGKPTELQNKRRYPFSQYNGVRFGRA
jgi:hypothetical protein